MAASVLTKERAAVVDDDIITAMAEVYAEFVENLFFRRFIADNPNRHIQLMQFKDFGKLAQLNAGIALSFGVGSAIERRFSLTLLKRSSKNARWV